MNARSLLTSRRPNEGASALASGPRPTALGQWAEAILKKIELLLPKDFSLHFYVDDDLPLVFVDPVRVRDAFLVLLDNARTAMPGGGTIVVVVGNVFIEDGACDGSVVAPGHYVELAVADTGKGMNEGLRQRIVDACADANAPTPFEGRGLAVVRAVMAQCKGYVRVESSPGLGARFSLLFPVSHDEHREHDRDGKKPVLASGTQTVLVVDDDRAVRSIAARMLRTLGYVVLEAGDGLEALGMLSTRSDVDVVLSDVMMPRLDGYGLAKQVRERWPHVRLMMMSGYASLVGAPSDSFLSDVVFVQKPFTPALLAEKMRTAVEA